MKRNLKEDIRSGKITKLMLVSTDIDVIRENRDAMIYNVPREISNVYDDHFTLKTERCKDHMPTGIYEDLEAYYTAFSNYDGNILTSFYTVYQVL